jgi:hypothetical protein
MKNVEISQEGSKLIITVDLSKEFGRSSSGKTTIVASTEGNQKVGDVYVGRNANLPQPATKVGLA